jgi:hypothetical protein
MKVKRQGTIPILALFKMLRLGSFWLTRVVDLGWLRGLAVRWPTRDAATELNVGHVPQDMLAEVIKARAITAASSSGKAGNDAARFIFSVVGTIDDGGKQKSAAMEIKMSDEMAKFVLDKMIEA